MLTRKRNQHNSKNPYAFLQYINAILDTNTKILFDAIAETRGFTANGSFGIEVRLSAL